MSYSHGTTDITAAVVAGTYETPSLAAGATYLIEERITINQGYIITRLVTIRSATDPNRLGAVGFGYQ